MTKIVKHGKEKYELETPIAILIESIKELTEAMNKLRAQNGRV